MWMSAIIAEDGGWQSDFKWKWMKNRELGHLHDHDSIVPLIPTLI